MTTRFGPNAYNRHRFPAEIIRHGVWLYCRSGLSYRDVEDLMTERSVTLTYETVWYWCRKFGQSYANRLWHRCPRPSDTGHLDEVFLSMRCERHYPWRVGDRDGHIFDTLVQRHRDTRAAKQSFRKLFKRLTYVPGVMSSDKPASDRAAKRELLPSLEHRQHTYLNNGAENSHQPLRQRERRMQRFKSAGHAQRFLAADGPIMSHFRPWCHRPSAFTAHQEMRQRFRTRGQVRGLAMAAYGPSAGPVSHLSAWCLPQDRLI
jgi:putative transposase